MNSYVMRVEGLGEVKALFLPSATTDEEARRDLKITMRSDDRVKLLELFRTWELDINKSDATTFVDTYLLTGIPKNAAGNVRNIFFSVESGEHAIKIAKTHDWLETKLYRCYPIAID